MGGRALVAGFGAAAQVFLLAVLIAGAADAVEVPAEAQPADLASSAPNAVEPAESPPGEADQEPAASPASEDEILTSPAPASAGEDEPSATPAAAPASEEGRDPADALDTAVAPPSGGDQKPADTAAVAPGEAQQPPTDTAAPAPSEAEQQHRRHRSHSCRAAAGRPHRGGNQVEASGSCPAQGSSGGRSCRA